MLINVNFHGTRKGVMFSRPQEHQLVVELPESIQQATNEAIAVYVSAWLDADYDGVSDITLEER